MHVRRATAALGAVLALLVGTACEDEPEPQVADLTETPSSSEPTSYAPSEPSRPVEPIFPPAADELTDAGAVVYIEHFFDMVNYAQATGDVVGLDKLATSTCSSCLSGSREISEIYRAGGRIVGSQYSISEPRARPLRAGRLKLAEVRVLATTTKGRATGAGSLNRPYPAGQNRYRFTLVQQQGRWLVVSIEVT